MRAGVACAKERPDPQDVLLQRATGVSVPKGKARGGSSGLISIIGVKGDSLVAKTVALPIEAPIDRLIVQLKPDLTPRHFDMRPAFKDFCRKDPKSPLCQDR